MVAVVELSQGPGTTAAYARAALGLLPGARRGAVLPDVEVRQRGARTDRSHLAAYDRVCGFRLTDTLPVTYPHVLAFPLAMRLMTAADFPLPLIGLVHVTNRITIHRPIPSGAALDLSVRAADLRDHPRGRQFDMIATAAVEGEEVWRGLSTYLRLSPAGPATGPSGPPPVSPDAQPPPVSSNGQPSPASPEGQTSPVSPEGQPSPVSPEGQTAQASPEGQPSPVSPGGLPSPGGSVWRVPARVGGDYASVSGDRNPIHTSWLGARLFGFPQPIAHGMWTKARALAALEGRLPDACTVEVAFRQPLLLPATATFTAAPATGGWTFSVTSRRPHLTGTVTT